MSGRDLREFLRSHVQRTPFAGQSKRDELAHAVVTDSQSRKANIKKVDYNKLEADISDLKAHGSQQLHRVTSLVTQGKASKDATLQREHRDVWLKEKGKMDTSCRSIQYELDFLCGNALADCDKDVDSETFATNSAFWKDVIKMEGLLTAEREKFWEDKMTPLLSIRNSIKGCLLSHTKDKTQSCLSKMSLLHKALLKTKEEHLLVSTQLEEEVKELQEEINLAKEKVSFSNSSVKTTVNMLTSVPIELANLVSSDKVLEKRVMLQFTNLNDHFLTLLRKLDEDHQELLRCDKFGGWDEEENATFHLIMEQYATYQPMKRALYMDRLRKQFLRKSRAEIVSHEKWYFSKLHYQNRKNAYLRSWTMNREELILRSQVLSEEALKSKELKQLKEETIEKQKELCHQLHQKLSIWMEQKLEALRLEGTIAERIRVQEENRRKHEIEQRSSKIKRKKQELEVFHAQKEQEKQKILEDEQKRLAALQKQLREQARMDRERVVFREMLRTEHLKALEKKSVLDKQANLERERRLELIREQVRIEAPADPLRLLRETKSYQSKLESTMDEELQLQTPLFIQHGFTDKQLAADKRLKIEVALRKAGLHDSDYARRMLVGVPPPSKPRPDMESTLFKKQ